MNACPCDGSGIYATDRGMKVCSCPAGYRRLLYLRMTDDERKAAVEEWKKRKQQEEDERRGAPAGG